MVNAANKRTALKVLRVCLAFASLMVVVAVVSIPLAQRALKVAQCSVKHTEEARGVVHLVALRVQKEVHYFAKGMEAENAARQKGAQNAYTGGLFSVWHMEEGRGAPFLNAPRVPEAELISVFVMEVESGANRKAVGRVHKAALIYARLTEEASDVL